MKQFCWLFGSSIVVGIGIVSLSGFDRGPAKKIEDDHDDDHEDDYWNATTLPADTHNSLNRYT